MSDLFKLLFANDESVVSSVCEDPANQNQIQKNMTLKYPKEVRMTTKAVNVLLKSNQHVILI